MKKIAVLTSGGDAPGMNAAIRAVVRSGIYNNAEVLSIRDGFNGLISARIDEMNLSSVADIIHRGGTILKTTRSDEFKTEEGQKKAMNVIEVLGIKGIIVIGGGGSLKGAKVLNSMGVPTIGVPGTIDNDLGYTDYTIGFDTSVNTVVDAISKIRETSISHGRANIIEVMGRDCGNIALYAGLASGAESIILPEMEFDIDEVCRKLLRGRNRGKLHSIIILTEGVANPIKISDEIKEKTGIETRATILGHIQRGGSPTAFDRILASKMGAKAVKLLVQGAKNRAVGTQGKHIVDMDLDKALGIKSTFDIDSYELANVLSI
ncbi:MAG TPA: 6-phosphofructokinase [Oscillospiraceae bacterium]|nr:6-phosphofructokinase [Oscillospiraceae bacterium]